MNDMTREIAIRDRIDETKASQLEIGGGVTLTDMSKAMEFSKMMSVGGPTVPKHVRGQPGVALGLIMQAIHWQMDPYQVARKSYVVGDTIGFEAQLIHAVILNRAPIKGRPKITYDGEGADRRCTVRFALRDEPGESIEYTSPRFADITTKNSPLWKADPDQQLFYYSSRACARRHFPDVLLGAYAEDEVEPEPRRVVSERADAPKGLAAKLDALGIEKELADGLTKLGMPAEQAKAYAHERHNSPVADAAPGSNAGDEAAEEGLASSSSAADSTESAYDGADTVEGGESTIRARLGMKSADPTQDKPEADEGATGEDVAGDAPTADDVIPPGDGFTFFRNRQWPAELAECKTRIAVTARLEHHKALMESAFTNVQIEELKAMAAERIADIQATKKAPSSDQ